MESKYSDFMVYVDESGDHSLQSIDKNYPVFVLAFCIFYKNHYRNNIVPQIQKLKFDYFGHDMVILHEHEIRKEKGDFNIFTSREQREGFMNVFHLLLKILILFLLPVRLISEKFHKMKQHTLIIFHSNIV